MRNIRILPDRSRGSGKYVLPPVSFAQKLVHITDLQGLREKIALPVFATEDPQLMKLMNAFNAFGDDLKVQNLCQGDDGSDDLAVIRIALHRTHERPVNLQQVYREFMKITEA